MVCCYFFFWKIFCIFSKSFKPCWMRALRLSSSKLALVMVAKSESVMKWLTSSKQGQHFLSLSQLSVGIVFILFSIRVPIVFTIESRMSIYKLVSGSLPQTPLVVHPVLFAVSWHWKQNIFVSFIMFPFVLSYTFWFNHCAWSCFFMTVQRYGVFMIAIGHNCDRKAYKES